MAKHKDRSNRHKKKSKAYRFLGPRYKTKLRVFQQDKRHVHIYSICRFRNTKGKENKTVDVGYSTHRFVTFSYASYQQADLSFKALYERSQDPRCKLVRQIRRDSSDSHFIAFLEKYLLREGLQTIEFTSQLKIFRGGVWYRNSRGNWSPLDDKITILSPWAWELLNKTSDAPADFCRVRLDRVHLKIDVGKNQD
jgi:hypothetical protein